MKHQRSRAGNCGRILHEKTDVPAEISAAGTQISRAMPLVSQSLGITGVADTVEFLADGTPFPIEYKHGKPNAHGSDEIQLCAQALCLEEMTGKRVPEAAIFYGKTRRRKSVPIDENLRARTLKIISETREILARAETPKANYVPEKCDACSLKEICLPKTCGNAHAAEKRWQNSLEINNIRGNDEVDGNENSQ